MKAPRLGEVKTRFQPELSPGTSLELYHAMGKDLVNHFSLSDYFDLFIQYSPETAEGKMRSWLGSHLHYIPQRGANLGEKLQRAFLEAFNRHHQKVCIMGSDLPTLQQNDILNSFVKLESADVVLGPATDGGYYLVALKQSHPEIFHDIDWSTELVFQQTLTKAQQQKLSVMQLEMREDVDTYQEVVALWNHFLENEDKLKKNIPYTVNVLKKIFAE